MKVGLDIIRFDWPGGPTAIGPLLTRIARTADAAGFASIWVMDHFYQMGDEFGPVDDPMLEGHTAISHIAAVTEQIQVGVLVSGVTYRPAGALIKQATTLDVLSGGRSYFGIGAGWYEEEAQGLGLPFPPRPERFARLEETLQIAHHVWRGDRADFSGRFTHLAGPIVSPPPLAKPHPPILIGGEGERRTLRLVARYGDACNLNLGMSVAEGYERVERLQHKLDVLRRHCEREGRPYEAIEKTALGHVALGVDTDAADVVRLCHTMARFGLRHLIFHMDAVETLAPLEEFGRAIIPEVAGL